MSGRDRRLSTESHDEESPLLENAGRSQQRGWRGVIENEMTWAWYATIMSSAGVALIIRYLPYQFHNMWVIGAIIYIISLIGFLLFLLIHAFRFILNPRLLPRSITNPSEGSFVSTFAVALGMLILDAASYGDKMGGHKGGTHGGEMMLRVFWWVFFGVAVVFGVGSPLALFNKTSGITNGAGSTSRNGIIRDVNTEGTGFSILAAQSVLPLVIVGPAAAAVASHVNLETGRNTALTILAVGATAQGMGILISLLYLSTYISRLQTHSFPSRPHRPSMFLAVCAPAFTSYAAAALGQQALVHFPIPDPAPPVLDVFSGVALYQVGVVAALVFWGLAAWFFVLGVVGNLSGSASAGAAAAGAGAGEVGIGGGAHQLQMFALVFPNVGFALATISLSAIFKHPKALAILSEILGLAVVAVWLVVTAITVYGVVSGRMWRRSNN